MLQSTNEVWKGGNKKMAREEKMHRMKHITNRHTGKDDSADGIALM